MPAFSVRAGGMLGVTETIPYSQTHRQRATAYLFLFEYIN